MRRFSGLLLVASVAGWPALAQPVDYNGLDKIRTHWVDVKEDVRKPLSKFAACVVSSDPKRSRKLVLDPFYGVGEQYEGLLIGYCLPARDYTMALEMTPTVIRFVLADAVFSRELKQSDPRMIAAAPALAPSGFDRAKYDGELARLKDAAQRNKSAELGRTITRDLEYFQFGECVVRADPASAKALLSTKIETDEEANALRTLMPALDHCQPPSKRVSLDVADVRGTLAVNYVRLAFASQQVAAFDGVRK